MHTIYYIGENTGNDFVALEIEKDPSNYVSHDSYTTWLKGKQWKATILRLKELPKAKTDDISAITKAREIEGIQDFGQGPNMKDGKVRLLSSVIHLKQLLMIPSTYRKRTHEWGVQCFQSMDDRVPLACGVTHNVEKRDFELNNDGAVYLKMIASYQTSRFFKSGLLNVVSPGAEISEFFEIQLNLTNTYFCRCQAKVSFKRLVVNLKETTRCIVPQLKGFGIQEDTRTGTLRDVELNSLLDLSAFTQKGTVFVADLEKSIYDCNLPNIGPTFHSETCSRSYALEIRVTCECDSKNSCRSEFSTLIDIDVAINDSTSDMQPQDQVLKKQDVLSLEKVDLSPFIAKDVEAIMAKRLRQVHSHSFGYHVSATAMDDSVMVISSVFLQADFLEEKRSFFGSSSESEKREVKENLALLLVPSETAWIVEDASLESTSKEKFHFSVFSSALEAPCFTDMYFLGDSSFTFSHCKFHENPVSPGTLLDEIASLELYQRTLLTDTISITWLTVEFLQQTTTRTADGFQEVSRKHTRLKLWQPDQRFQMGPHNDKWRFLNLSRYFRRCRIPEVPPSVLSNTVHRTYSLCVSIIVHQKQEETDHCLSTNFSIPVGRKVDLVGSPPPAYIDSRGTRDSGKGG